MANADLLNELVEIERRGWDALCNGTGADFYGTLMTEDAVMVLAHGFVLDRAAVVDSLNEAPPWRTYTISDERLIDAGAEGAVLVYAAHAYQEGDRPAFIALMSSVYRRRGTEWKLALYQQTPLPDTPAGQQQSAGQKQF